MRTFKYRWSSAFGLSFICHGIILGAVAGLLVLFPPAQPSREPIEVDLVSDIGGGGGGGGGGNSETEELPKIHEAKATPTAPPPAVPAEADEEAANDVHEIAQSQDKAAPSPSSSEGSSSASSSDGGSGGGSGGGTGTGDGTGTGSGTGSGSGSGSGGGTGDGNGDGYGSGSGEGSGGGETTGIQILSAPAPSYPESARRAGISGTTVVGMTVSTDGSVSSAWVESSSGNSTLDSAAVSAVYSWRFVPAKQNGTPVTANSRVPITFNLN
ncbi:energy transducer TonB [uncultured Dialister sp.]|uniref:energy transducer TonB n=1 Tax=uncultured Dialister sp. TaxID=278064 RepID=UPI0026DD1CBB|nr:energy transducer TonB [uncultured Dialister sp.]